MITFEQITEPLFNGDIIYDESVTFVEENGKAAAPLYFDAEEIINVTSADKTKEYKENTDWIYKNNKIELTPGSSIFRFNINDLIFDDKIEGQSFETSDGRYSLFHEGHFFHDRQISVTYRKKSSQCFGYKQKFCKNELKKTIKKLKDKRDVTIVLYGDSISEGANSSGTTLTTPFLPKWGDMVIEKIKRSYGVNVVFYNTSMGGRDSSWGVQNAQERVADYRPDLAIIAFGMNDRIDGKSFSENIRKIMSIITKTTPDTEYILCATTLPNQMLPEFCAYQKDYRDALYSIAKDGVAVASFYNLQKELLRKKRFIDLTGNNVNHLNDFMIRCHTELVCSMLIEK